ncbi:MAG: 4a-hydroxytetrahydrobiopterin dehydratase [Frankiaceae bacterium]
MPEPLDDRALDATLHELGSWTGDRTGLHREVTAPSFPAAIELVRRIADVAEELDHHPDIDIRWRTVRLACSTHSAGDAVTELDVRLARAVEAVIAESGAGG